MGHPITKQQTPFVMIPRWVLAACTPQAVKLYGVLMGYADSSTLEAWPTRQTLAVDMGFSAARVVDKYVSELEEAGALVVIRKRVGSVNLPNHYHLVMNKQGVVIDNALPLHGNSGPCNSDVSEGHQNYNEVVIQNALNQEPLIKNQEQEDSLPIPDIPEPKKPTTSIDDDFAEWYAEYPLKRSRGHAIKAYRAARAKGVSRETLLDAAKRYTTDPNRKPAYTSYPASWLNGEDYLDYAGRVAPSRPTTPATVVPLHLRNTGPDLDPYGDDEELLKQYEFPEDVRRKLEEYNANRGTV